MIGRNRFGSQCSPLFRKYIFVVIPPHKPTQKRPVNIYLKKRRKHLI